MTEAPSRVVLLGKPGCHLCDDARPTVAQVCEELAVPWEEKSILSEADLHARFRDEIPVVLIDGDVHSVWRVDADRLRAALTS